MTLTPHQPKPSPFDPGARFALVVDDTPMMLSAMKTFLENLGFVVLTARDGIEAVELAPIFPFSVIITDIQMPRMDGLMATRQIRAMGGCLAHVPIIACSASMVSPEVVRAAGINEFIAKGTDLAVLVACIDRLVAPERQNA